MKPDITKTFINPIVLPDYPVLQVLRPRHSPDEMMNPGNAWGRGGKKMLSIADLMREDGREYGMEN